MDYILSDEAGIRAELPIGLHTADENDPQYYMPFHWHAECEVIYITSGVFNLSADGEDIRLTSGDAAFIPKGMIHGGEPEGATYECILSELPEHVTAMGQSLGARKAEQGTRAYTDIVNAFAEAHEKKPGYDAIVTGLLCEAVGELSRVSYRKGSTRHKQVEQLRRPLVYIREHYPEQITLTRLANEAEMTPGYFCRFFSTVTGRTPIDYLNFYRTERAGQLLISSRVQISEIGKACGFPDSNYFSRIFRKYKGISPIEYRKRYRKESDTARRRRNKKVTSA